MAFTFVRHGLVGRAFWPTVCVLLAGGIAGCGSGDACSLSGQVTFNGKPILDGNIRFNPIDDTPGPGGSAKIVDGAYEIATEDGMLAGGHRVLISATRATGRMVRAENLDGGPSQVEQVEQYIPDRYNRTSELVVDLKPGENTEDFSL